MNKIGTRITVLLILLFLFVGASLLWWQDAISALNPSDTSTQIFVVSEGEAVRSIVNRLKNAGLIKDQIGFFLKVKLSGFDSKIQAGDFRLSSSMDVATIIEELSHGTLDVWVTTLEGWRVEEIALKLAQELAIPEQEFLKVAQEGYMFPDTYLLPKEASAAAVAKIIEDNFGKRVAPDIRDGIKNQDLTFDQGLTLASIVEREGRTTEDRSVIAGILLKRLKNDWPLQADATLQYALGYQANERTWWKKNLFDEDKKIDSPYNTYEHKGLPPAPICNPGLAAIRAVAFPEESSYWYYIHDKEGGVHYAETIEEHRANINKYLQ